MRRLPDWPERLYAYIELVRNRPLDAVEFNCGIYAAGAVMAITGMDPLEQVLDVPLASPNAVARILVARGGVAGIASEYFGGEPLAPLLARRGDVLIKDGDGGDTLGVCVGDHALFLCETGLQRRELMECRGCWAVG